MRDLQKRINYDRNSPYEKTCIERHKKIRLVLKEKAMLLKIPQRGVCISCGSEFRAEAEFEGLIYNAHVFAKENKTLLSAIKGDFGKEIKDIAKKQFRRQFKKQLNVVNLRNKKLK